MTNSYQKSGVDLSQFDFIFSLPHTKNREKGINVSSLGNNTRIGFYVKNGIARYKRLRN